LERYSKNLRPCLSQLKPYVAGKGYTEITRKYGIPQERIVKLGSNENPYGPSPSVIKALRSISSERYPETEELMEGLARYTGYPEELIVAGTGMDGVMDTLSRIFLDKGDRTFIPTPTFSYYEILTVMSGGQPIFAERLGGYDVPTEVPRDVKMAFICSPNNPTGNQTPEEDVRKIVESTDGIVFLDEAYVEFADRSLLGLVREYDNLVVGRTTSKAFGLAGLRLGYAVAPEWIAEQYRRAAPPFFGLSCASVAAGAAAVKDLDFMHESVSKVLTERDRLTRETKARPSQGNFLYLETKKPSGSVVEDMMSKGVIIRDCRPFRGAGGHHVRVTVGTPEQNDKFLEANGEICA
jgi:histidinol-phosphate aminotransferase